MPVKSQPIVTIDNREYVSGDHALSLGAYDARLLRCMINTGKGMALHDSTYTKTCASPMQGVTIDLNICSNNVTDKSGNSNHPTLTNVTLLNGEMQFDGSTSYATIPRNADFETTEFSIRAKFKFNVQPVQGSIIFNKKSSGGWFAYADNYGGANFGIAFMGFDASWNACGPVGNWGVNLAVGTVFDYVITGKQFASGLFELKIYLNGSFVETVQSAHSMVLNSGDLKLCADEAATNKSAMSFYAFQMFDHVLSAAEVKALYDGRTTLYPSTDSLDFTQTVTSVKDLQWFFRNPTSTIEVAPTVLADDTGSAYWLSVNGFTTSDDSTTKMIGTDSFSFVSDGVTSSPYIRHVYGSNQNWSTYDILSFWLYGANTGKTMTLAFNTVDWTNYYSYQITDNFTGWQIFHILLGNMTANGSPTWTTVKGWQLAIGGAAAPLGTTWRIDRVILDVCPSIPVKKLSIDGLYLENQVEESPVASDVSVISDEAQASFWSPGTGVTVTNDTGTVQKGTNSLKIVAVNVAQYNNLISHWYGTSPAADYSGMDFLSFWWYGSNSGHILVPNIQDANGVHGGYSTFTDNFTGWKRIVMPLQAFISVSGMVWNSIQQIFFTVNEANTSGTWYLDRVVLQKGRWLFLEVAVPDALYQYQNFKSSSGSWLDFEYVVWSVWSGSAYVNFVVPEIGVSGDYDCVSSVLKFLNSQSAYAIYGETSSSISVKSATAFISGLYSQLRGYKDTWDMYNQTITYNGKSGCRRRVGLALKMPPADLIADSTHGIGQTKLKLEVYCQ